MPSKWRRFEVLIPLQSNDGQEIPEELLGEAVFEILDQFTGVGFENLNVVGHWLHEGTVYRNNLSRIIVDVPDTVKNRKWMKEFKVRWKGRLDQLEIWMVSYRIDIE
jgi:hypothetical protein